MSEEDNKALVRRSNAALNQANWAELVDEFTGSFTEEFVKEHTLFRTAFPDYQFTIEDMIAEGDKVVVRGMVRATHKAEFPVGESKGVAPTGKQVTWAEVQILQIADGKLVDGWLLTDGVSRLQQLGVLPLPA